MQNKGLRQKRWVRGEIHGLGLYCTLSLSSGGGMVGGQPAAYFLLSLAVPNCSCSDRINESGGIRIRNRPAANCKILTTSQVRNLATVGSPAAVLYCNYWLFRIWLMEQCS